MSRAAGIAFFVICGMFAMNLMHDMNTCTMYGSAATEPLTGAGLCPNSAGVGHPFIPLEIQPLWGYTIRGTDNTILNASNPTSYNSTLQDIVEYKPAPADISDTIGFFSFVITGARFLVNGFFMALFGLPGFLQNFYLPPFMTTSIGAILFIIQIVGLYEFLTGKEMV